MTTTAHILTSVAELAIAMPASLAVLDRLAIDYCCNGAQSVTKACADRGITTEALLGLIEAEPKPAGTREWAGTDMTGIIRFIVDTHHRYTRGAIAMLPALATKVLGVHGERHPELARVAELA